MSDHTRVRELYESGLWIARISKSAWHEMRVRHHLEDEGLNVRDAEIARLEREQAIDDRWGYRVLTEDLSLDDTLGREHTLGELLGVA